MQLEHDPHTDARIIYATHTDTWLWSQSAAPGQPLNSRWPASALAGHDVTIIIAANGDLLDLIGPSDVGADELGAFIDYALNVGPQECATCPPGMGHNRPDTAPDREDGTYWTFDSYTEQTGHVYRPYKTVQGVMRGARAYAMAHKLRPMIREVTRNGVSRERPDLTDRAYSRRDILA
jgi:hypothetical protein